MFDPLWYWIRERESIRIKKEAGEPRPWTSDPILHAHHFCNVRREDDRGTKERREIVKRVDVTELPEAYTLSNLLNYAPSIQIALVRPDWVKILQERLDRGEKVFHTAYVVSTCGRSMNKLDYVAELVEAVARKTFGRTTCRSVYDQLSGINGLGSFLAGQIVADLKNDRFLAGAVDWKTFSVIGPGSKKGLSYLFNKPIMAGQYQQCMGLLEAQMPEDIKDMKIHRQDLQNCLCEYSKYHRYENSLPGRVRHYHV